MDAPILVIAGPTASGKTSLAIELARGLDGEIISADSRQIYRCMNVGTAKPTPDEQAAAVHHLIDIVDPDVVYDASQWASAAAAAIDSIISRDRLPIIAGGSGFYIEALFAGLSPIPSIPGELRHHVKQTVTNDPDAAHAELAKRDPEAAGRISPSDPQRLSRALEVYKATGKPISYFQSLPKKPATKRPYLGFGLDWPRETLWGRINQRSEAMIDGGLLEETRALFECGYDRTTYALNTFGYREMAAVMEGDLSMEDALEALQQGSRQYAKRQMTWFRNRSGLNWIDPEREPCEEILRRLGSGRKA